LVLSKQFNLMLSQSQKHYTVFAAYKQNHKN